MAAPMSAILLALSLLALPHAQQPPQDVLDRTIADYAAAWSEPDPARRRAYLEKVWAPGGTYTDPATHAEGVDALLNAIAAFHKQFPGVKIVATSHADYHHHMLRFSWRMTDGAGATRMEGIDFGELAADGRIKRIVGFFGPLKAK